MATAPDHVTLPRDYADANAIHRMPYGALIIRHHAHGLLEVVKEDGNQVECVPFGARTAAASSEQQ